MPGKEFFGVVTSDKMEKTLVVSVQRRYKERRTGKIVSASKKYKIHYEGEEAKTGDTVSFTESRAFSKDKKFRFLKILRKSEMALSAE